eukprot:gene12825-17195_t
MEMLCPISTSIHTKSTGLFSYPTNLSHHISSDIDTVPCTARSQYSNFIHDNTEVSLNLTCFTKSHECPWTPKNQYDALSAMNDMIPGQNPMLCINPERDTNIIVFGGSVSLGHYAEGYKCEKDQCPNAKQHKQEYWAWPSYLSNWLKSNSSLGQNFNLYNCAMSGQSVDSGAEMLHWLLDFNHVPPLTGNDIIFLDFSFNDGAHCNELRSRLVAEGLESMILRLFHYSQPGSWPIIIILEMQVFPAPESNDPKSYTLTYRKVAKHYNIPIWSYRDAISMEWTRSHDSIFHNKFIVNNFHPSWFTQLLYSDLISGLLIKEINKCEKFKKSGASFVNSQLWYNNPSLMNIDKIPPPLIAGAGVVCEKPLIELVANDYMEKNKSHNNNDNDRSISFTADDWNVKLTHKDKIGWISSFNSNASLSIHYFNVTLMASSTKSPSLFRQHHHLYLMYLSTYKNAGVIEVRVCGKLQLSIDSLWQDYNKHSLSISSSKDIQFYPPSICPIKTDPITNNQLMEVKISLAHVYEECWSKDTHRCKAREAQKFDLKSIQLCS